MTYIYFAKINLLSSFLCLKDFSLNNLSIFLFPILFSFALKDIKVTNKNIAIMPTEVAPFTRTEKYWQGKFNISINLGPYLNTISDSAVTKVTFGILMALLYSRSDMISVQTLHKKWGFPWRTSSVNVTKSSGNWRNP